MLFKLPLEYLIKFVKQKLKFNYRNLYYYVVTYPSFYHNFFPFALMNSNFFSKNQTLWVVCCTEIWNKTEQNPNFNSIKTCFFGGKKSKKKFFQTGESRPGLNFAPNLVPFSAPLWGKIFLVGFQILEHEVTRLWSY